MSYRGVARVLAWVAFVALPGVAIRDHKDQQEDLCSQNERDHKDQQSLDMKNEHDVSANDRAEAYQRAKGIKSNSLSDMVPLAAERATHLPSPGQPEHLMNNANGRSTTDARVASATEQFGSVLRNPAGWSSLVDIGDVVSKRVIPSAKNMDKTIAFIVVLMVSVVVCFLCVLHRDWKSFEQMDEDQMLRRLRETVDLVKNIDGIVHFLPCDPLEDVDTLTARERVLVGANSTTPRYFVVVPADGDKNGDSPDLFLEKCDAQMLSQRLAAWHEAHLTWWDSQEAFRNKTSPMRGSERLLDISKLVIRKPKAKKDQEGGTSSFAGRKNTKDESGLCYVSITFQPEESLTETGSKKILSITMPSVGVAEEWSRKLKTVLIALRLC